MLDHCQGKYKSHLMLGTRLQIVRLILAGSRPTLRHGMVNLWEDSHYLAMCCERVR
jgi:hypothetical protein